MNKTNQPEKRALWLLDKLLELPRWAKIGTIVSVDAAIAAIATIGAFYLRLSHWNFFDRSLLYAIAISIVVFVPIFFISGVYRSILRFSGGKATADLTYACIAYSFVLILIFGISVIPGIPRTISVIQPVLFFVGILQSRALARYLLNELPKRMGAGGPVRRVLIYGAGRAGQQLVSSIRHEREIEAFAFVDDDRRLHGHNVDGIRVIPSTAIGRWIKKYDISDIFLAIPSLSRRKRVDIINRLELHGCKVMTLPGLQEVVDGDFTFRALRQVEVEDLLGRDPVQPNELLLGRTIANKVILVTGAGGSIGSELCRQILNSRPSKLILVDMDEFSLYSMQQELKDHRLVDGQTKPEILFELANLTDRSTVARLFDRWTPNTVFHAAAYKHVPLVENNAISGLRNNIFGTLHTALAAEKAGVERFILISTDKAVRPTNIMGASKRVCELVLQGLAEHSSKTKFAMVRFGNVLGSSGSVVPQFKKQIANGGPVTVTHKDVIRYFMTIPEAAELVIQAGAMASGGEVYVLDMGKSVKIMDLARTMINLSGLTERSDENPDGDIEIVEIGLRPGEKLFEELLIGNDPQPTKHVRIMKAKENSIAWTELEERLGELELLLSRGDRSAAIAILSALVPEYKPTQSVSRVG